MVRILIATGLVALIVMVWVLFHVVGGGVVRLHDAAIAYAKCIDFHSDEISGLVRDSGNVRSLDDMEYNQYRAKVKMQEIQATCLDQSGFKTLVLRELENTKMEDSDRQSIRRELGEAETFDDLERIEKQIAQAEQDR